MAALQKLENAFAASKLRFFSKNQS